MGCAKGLLNQKLERNVIGNDDRVSVVVALIFIGLLFGLYGAIYLINEILPTALSVADEKYNPDAFIAERAQQDLKYLTDIGPRTVGSYENEVLAAEFLKKKIRIIQQQAHQNQKVDLDLQVVTNFYGRSNSISVDANLQNIVVKVHSKNNSNHSLLINAHFDSAPTSPGGSDDGINCAIMLEVLRKLSRSSEVFKHNIIFLFNGAEETGLQGAYGFISQHKWAKEVRVVVNLEAIGAGGRIMLFQTGPNQPWLLDYYRNVPYPDAQVVGEEIYESTFVSSNTDFAVFKKFGIVGLDFAYIKDGYRYHTKFDGFSNIPSGTFQHAGANLLSLAKNLANATELSNLEKQPKRKAIYYDFLGLFLICCPETTSTVIHVMISLFSLIVAVKGFYDFGKRFLCKSLLYVLMTLSAVLLGWISAGLSVTAIAFSINALQFSMSWYSNTWIILGLYVIPVLVCCCGFLALLDCCKLTKYKAHLSRTAQTQIQAQVLRLIWTIVLLMGTCFRIRSTYLVLMPVLFHTLAFAIIEIVCLQHASRKWQILYILGTIIPNIFLIKLAVTGVIFFVPIFGRSASLDIPIAIFSLISTLLITSVYTPLITMVRKPFLLLTIMIGFFIIFFVIVFTPLGFPYSGNPDSPALQSLTVIYDRNKTIQYNTNNTYYNESKFFVWCDDGDPRGASKKYLKRLERMKVNEEDTGQVQERFSSFFPLLYFSFCVLILFL